LLPDVKILDVKRDMPSPSLFFPLGWNQEALVPSEDYQPGIDQEYYILIGPSEWGWASQHPTQPPVSSPKEVRIREILENYYGFQDFRDGHPYNIVEAVPNVSKRNKICTFFIGCYIFKGVFYFCTVFKCKNSINISKKLSVLYAL